MEAYLNVAWSGGSQRKVDRITDRESQFLDQNFKDAAKVLVNVFDIIIRKSTVRKKILVQCFSLKYI